MKEHLNYLDFLPMIESKVAYEVKAVDCQRELLAKLIAGDSVIGTSAVLSVSHYDEGWGERIFDMPLTFRSQKPWDLKIFHWVLEGDCRDGFGDLRLFSVLFAEHQCFIKDITNHGPGLSRIARHLIDHERGDPTDNIR